MQSYTLSLAGLSVLLQTPAPITVTERLAPFLREDWDACPDLTIRVQAAMSLPAVPADTFLRGLTGYAQVEDSLLIFHYETPNSPPFAATTLLPGGDILLEYLPDYGHFFTGSSGIFNRIGMENMLLQHSGLLLHASLIEFNRKGIAFTGPSGVGKSTQAKLWTRFTEAQILNGDRAVLRTTKDGWFAYGSPYAGTSGIYRNESVPLAAIVVLRQAKANRLRRLTGAEAFSLVYSELSVHRWDPAFVQRITDLFLTLSRQTPMYLLECLPDEDAVMTLKRGLSL